MGWYAEHKDRPVTYVGIADPDVYDEYPEKPFEGAEYDTGYLTAVFFMVLKSRKEIRIRNIIRSTNAKAIVVTNYKSGPEEEYPYTIAYIIHETEFERTLFERLIVPFLVESKLTEEQYHTRFYYDARWNCATHKPKASYTPGEMYRKELNIFHIKDLNERKELRKKYMIMKGCYEPFSKKDPTCRSRGHHAGSNYQICVRCCLSTYYDRYEYNKCIRKITPKEKEILRKKRRGG